MPYNRDVTEVWDKAMSCTAEGISLSEVSVSDHPLVYVNGGFERMTGYSKDEVIGKNCRFLQGEETDKNQVDKIRNAISNNQHCTVEFVNYRKDGTKFWNRLTVSPVSKPSDEIRYYVGVQSDITHLKLIERQLKDYAFKLEQKNVKLKESLELFDETLGRSLFNASNSSKKLIASERDELDERAKQMLKEIHDSTSQANDLVLNMRTLIKTLGGTDFIHNIDMVDFKAKRKHEE